jgi:hypothetical protein
MQLTSAFKFLWDSSYSACHIHESAQGQIAVETFIAITWEDMQEHMRMHMNMDMHMRGLLAICAAICDMPQK